MVVRRTCDHDLSDRSNLHLSELKRVVETMPGFPVDSVSVSDVMIAVVETVEIRRTTVTVPPTTFVTASTVGVMSVVVVVKR